MFFQCKVLNMLNTSAVLILHAIAPWASVQFRTVSCFSSSVLVDTDSCLWLLEKQNIFNRKMANKSPLHKIKQYLVSECTIFHQHWWFCHWCCPWKTIYSHEANETHMWIYNGRMVNTLTVATGSRSQNILEILQSFRTQWLPSELH